MVLELSHFGRAPYPSGEVPISLVDGTVIYTQEITTMVDNMTPCESFPYSGMMLAFQVSWENGGLRVTLPDFGNQSQLSANTTATVHQDIMGGSLDASIDITDSTGDGSFDMGDTIAFDIAPLEEDVVYTMGLLWTSQVGGAVAMEVSFAIHNGKLYTWYSDYLNDRPWYDLPVV